VAVVDLDKLESVGGRWIDYRQGKIDSSRLHVCRDFFRKGDVGHVVAGEKETDEWILENW